MYVANPETGASLDPMIPRELRDLLRHARNYVSGDAVAALVQLAAIPVIASMLTTADYGMYQIVVTYISIAAVVLTFNFHGAISRYYYEETVDTDRKEFVGTSVGGSLLLLSCFSVIAMLIIRWRGTLYDIDLCLAALIGLFGACRVLKTSAHSICIALKRSAQSARIQALHAISTLAGACMWLIAVDQPGYLDVLYGLLCGELLALGLTAVVVRDQWMWRPARGHLRYIAGYAFPLVPYTLGNLALAQIDRVMIKHTLGASDAGLYSLSYNVAMSIGMVALALQRTITPDWFAFTNKKLFDKADALIEKSLELTLLASLAAMLFAGPFMSLVLDERYHDSLSIIPIVVVGYVTQAIAGYYLRVIGYTNRMVFAAAVSIVSGIVNVALNAVLLSRYGYKISAYTTVASFVVLLTGSWFVARFVLRQRVRPAAVIRKPLVPLVLAYLVSLGSHHAMGTLALAVDACLFAGVAILAAKRHLRTKESN